MNCSRVLTGLAVLFVAAWSMAATPEQIETAIQRTKEYIYSQQQPDGTWENKPRDPTDKGNKHEGGQWGGRTALAVYSLLAAGESPQDPRLKRAIDFLRTEQMVGVYAVGLRSQVWYFLPPTNEVKSLMVRDARFLMSMINGPGTKGKGAVGHYGYVPGTTSYSHSRSQYAVLGIWAAAQMGIEIPNRYWQVVEHAWMANQDKSGGWTYQHPDITGHPVTPGMTAAGVATLYIIQDYLYANRGLDCRPGRAVSSDASIEAGMKWMAANMDKIATSKSHFRDFPMVTLYAIERIGVASGRKYIGDVDWFQKGADWLVSVQRKDGSFPSDHNAVQVMPSSCMALLFLSRGGAPILMNKLEYANEGAQQPGWNNRPRDVANVARWVGRQAGREHNWQVVGMQSRTADWHDAPILYISGNEALNLKEEDKQKLKRYVEQGGLILAHADCNSRAFTESVRRLCGELFPSYEFRLLPDDHIIYTNRFQRSRWRSKPQVMGLSNGSRELILLVASGDPARDWQTMNTGGNEASWELAANIYHYAVEGTATRRSRGTTHWLEKDPAIKPSQNLTVARLQTEWNWDPEPGGWERLAAYLHNRYRVDLKTRPVRLGEPIEGVKVAHLTGTADLRIDADEQATLKKFIEGGGTLIIDAAGGAGVFATAVEKALSEMYPGQELATIPDTDPLFKVSGEADTPIAWRSYTRRVLGSLPRGSRLKGIKVGDRWGVIYSREDLSTGLVGQEVDGIAGYTPATATSLMTRILFHTTGTRAEPAKPAPAKK